ncbi:RhuM family protein [Candidatus Venteria ishoeyi]|uniref:RhuM family protein n=1 Tax=Candidatus Venteria ishoeyi TaxID=1899563 RepID=UPI0025A64F3D|nr:RhuM family protein [Candidatus Venteria ishoeyi]MDM8545289.1 RhuM family protein [Candidatus Venteria ishoeyi]
MTENTNIATIDFYGQPISTVKKDGAEYVAMRQIVEGIGLNWASQSVKLRNNQEKFRCCDIATPSKGGLQPSLCLPLKKLNGYLFSINPDKVKSEIKTKVILYQEECFTALHDYFNYGYSLNNKLLETDQEKRDKLSADLRKLRVSDVDLYRKLTDAISATCVDYKSKDRKELGKFFSKLQDSFHFAVSGYTAAELVFHNVDCNESNAGMKSYAGDSNHITQADVKVGKNYLDEKAFRRFDILYDQLLSFVEMKVINGEEMTLDKWYHQLTSVIMSNGLNPFPGYQSNIKRNSANLKAFDELKKFKQLQLSKKV